MTHDVSYSSSLNKSSFNNNINTSDGDKLSPSTHINRSLIFTPINPSTNLHNTSTNKLFGDIDNIQHILDKPLKPPFLPNTDESHNISQQSSLREHGKHVNRDQLLTINNLGSSGPTKYTELSPLTHSCHYQMTHGISDNNNLVIKNEKSTHNYILCHRHNATNFSQTNEFNVPCSLTSIVSSPGQNTSVYNNNPNSFDFRYTPKHSYNPQASRTKPYPETKIADVDLQRQLLAYAFPGNMSPNDVTRYDTISNSHNSDVRLQSKYSDKSESLTLSHHHRF